MTETPIRDNYFWRVYLTGSYTPECCPNYLKEEHFQKLKSNIPKDQNLHLHHNRFFKTAPGKLYSHFILLDHQDWLACHNPGLLKKNGTPFFIIAGRAQKF